VAILFRLTELEVFGFAVINPQLRAMLERQQFAPRVERCLDELGGGTVEILARVYPVKGSP